MDGNLSSITLINRCIKHHRPTTNGTSSKQEFFRQVNDGVFVYDAMRCQQYNVYLLRNVCFSESSGGCVRRQYRSVSIHECSLLMSISNEECRQNSINVHGGLLQLKGVRETNI